MIKKGIGLLIAALFVISLSGAVGPAFAQGKTYTIAVLVKDSISPGWRMLLDGAKKEGAQQKVKVIEYAPLQVQNLEEQVRQMEDAIQKKVDAIVVAPINPQGIIPAIEKANAAKIPVITSNSRAYGGKIETFVGVENYDGAKKLGEYMIKKVGGKGNVILIEGNPAGQTNQDRVKGFKEAIAANSNIKLLAQQPAMFRRDQAMNVMENLLQSHPKVDLVMALNDEMALGAVKAMEAAGRKGVLVSGFDAAPEGLEAITAKRLVATLDQDLHAQGGLGVRAAVDVLNGKKIPDWIKTGGEVVDLSNVNTIVARIKSFSGK